MAKRTTQNGLVAAIIVNYNGVNILPDAIDSLKSSDYLNLVVIVVDNNSHDGSVEMLRDRYPDVVLIQNERNLGFAIGCNQGIRQAAEMNARYALFINSDAMVDAQTVSVLATFLKDNPQTGAVAPYIFYTHDKDLIWFGGGIVKLWLAHIAHRHIRRRFVASDHRAMESDYLTGCIFLARMDALDAVQGFDESYILYAEDVDLSLKMWRAGWQLWVTPEARGYHEVSVTSGGELSPFKAYYRGRGTAILLKRFVTGWEIPTIIIGGILGGVLISGKLMLKGKAKTMLYLWRGILDGLFRQHREPWIKLGQ